MENHKKNYLFRIGPLFFFPTDAEKKKQPIYMDGKEADRNVYRLIFIILYSLYSALLIGNFLLGDFFVTDSFRENIFILFLLPGVFSLIELHLTWIEKKTGISRSQSTHALVYWEWVVSILFYGIYIYNYLIK
ncbi:MAG: hypothetical protein ACO1O1_13305 [Adhaeribacter sp.]